MFNKASLLKIIDIKGYVKLVADKLKGWFGGSNDDNGDHLIKGRFKHVFLPEDFSSKHITDDGTVEGSFELTDIDLAFCPTDKIYGDTVEDGVNGISREVIALWMDRHLTLGTQKHKRRIGEKPRYKLRFSHDNHHY